MGGQLKDLSALLKKKQNHAVQKDKCIISPTSLCLQNSCVRWAAVTERLSWTECVVVILYCTCEFYYLLYLILLIYDWELQTELPTLA